MHERVVIVEGILDVSVMFALLIIGAIHANIEDFRYRKTLTPQQLVDHLEANRCEMSIW